MKAVCLDCYEIFVAEAVPKNHTAWGCPRMNCIGEVVLVDENMIPIIITLNKRGYPTRYCCSGHFWNLRWNTYIQFKGIKEFPFLPKGFKFEESNYTDDELEPHELPISSVYKSNENALEMSFLEKQKFLFDNLRKLLLWAEQLPEREVING